MPIIFKRRSGKSEMFKKFASVQGVNPADWPSFPYCGGSGGYDEEALCVGGFDTCSDISC